jgi:hypothetical protein
MDLAAIGKTARPGYWIGFSGAVGTIRKVDSLSVSMRWPIGSPTLEIRNVQLTMNAMDTIFEPVPLVDEFGQWMPAEWRVGAPPGDSRMHGIKKQALLVISIPQNMGDFRRGQSYRILPGRAD